MLLDLGPSEEDGLKAITRLRQWAAVPIIVTSVRDTEECKVRALDAGADDYLAKPFGTAELLARVRAVLRRVLAEPETAGSILAIGGFRLDIERRAVFVDGREVHLTPHEYKLFATLMKNADKVLTHRQLLSTVWGREHVGDMSYLRVYMLHLRQKLERNAKHPVYLLTEPGIGYRLKSGAK
jgi:two-component system KDP operon response regulator KdpE